MTSFHKFHFPIGWKYSQVNPPTRRLWTDGFSTGRMKKRRKGPNSVKLPCRWAASVDCWIAQSFPYTDFVFWANGSTPKWICPRKACELITVRADCSRSNEKNQISWTYIVDGPLLWIVGMFSHVLQHIWFPEPSKVLRNESGDEKVVNRLHFFRSAEEATKCNR